MNLLGRLCGDSIMLTGSVNLSNNDNTDSMNSSHCAGVCVHMNRGVGRFNIYMGMPF